MYDTPYERYLQTIIKELDSKKVYDEPHMIFHENVHSQHRYAVAGGNDMGSSFVKKYALSGQNDLGKLKTSKRELIRKVMKRV